MKSKVTKLWAAILCFVCSVGLMATRRNLPGSVVAAAGQQSSDPSELFRSIAQQLSSAPADICGWEEGGSVDFSGDAKKLEDKMFQLADAAVVQALNQTSGTPQERVSQVLKSLEKISETVHARWPADRRFHSQLLPIPPIIIVNYTLRSRSTFSVFGVPELLPEPGRKANKQWRHIGGDELRTDENMTNDQLSLYPLARGPSRRARFLALARQTACVTGRAGLNYSAYEWDPHWTGNFKTIIHRSGVTSGQGGITERSSLRSEPKGIRLPDIGVLQVSGNLVTLPYCWHSVIDGSPWASLCSVDTYDLSRDDIRFLSARTNRPDLETVARAIEYAQARDYPAVLAYCSSSATARSLVQKIPPDIFALSLEVTHLGLNSEKIEIRNDRHLTFLLEKSNSRWLIKSFAIE